MASFGDIKAGAAKIYNRIVAESVEAESLKTDSAQIGSGEAVSGGPIGDSGDWIPLQYHLHSDSTITTTATSYTTQFSQQLIFSPDDLLSITNVDALGVSFTATLTGDTIGEDVFARALLARPDNTYSEVSHTVNGNTETVVGPIEEISDYHQPDKFHWQIKVSGGQGSYLQPSVILWGGVK